MPLGRAAGPDELLPIKRELIPNFVFDAFNELIARHLRSDGSAVIKQEEVVSLIRKKAAEMSLDIDGHRTIFEKKWLDVEPLYRDAGWTVTYDRPVYYGGEDFEPYFKFSRGK